MAASLGDEGTTMTLGELVDEYRAEPIGHLAKRLLAAHR
jgi:hypothetical protein